MYKWVRTPSPSFPKATVNEYSITSLSSSYEQEVSFNAKNVGKPKMNNTWDRRDTLDAYIHHSIVIKQELQNSWHDNAIAMSIQIKHVAETQ